MENQENMAYLIDMVKQIHQTTILLSQNQTLLLEQYQSLTKKFDSLEKRFDSLDNKYDSLNHKYDSLDKKVDRYYEENRMEHFKMNNKLAHIENDIKDLQSDIVTVYELEKDSRNKIQHLL